MWQRVPFPQHSGSVNTLLGWIRADSFHAKKSHTPWDRGNFFFACFALALTGAKVVPKVDRQVTTANQHLSSQFFRDI